MKLTGFVIAALALQALVADAEPPALPGGVGRLAATAVAESNGVLVFGGYNVAEDGSELSLRDNWYFDPASGEFAVRAAMPVPVDDSVSLAVGNSIYLVSGWHNRGNVNLVQRYNTVTDEWDQATPCPGDPGWRLAR